MMIHLDDMLSAYDEGLNKFDDKGEAIEYMKDKLEEMCQELIDEAIDTINETEAIEEYERNHYRD